MNYCKSSGMAKPTALCTCLYCAEHATPGSVTITVGSKSVTHDFSRAWNEALAAKRKQG